MRYVDYKGTLNHWSKILDEDPIDHNTIKMWASVHYKTVEVYVGTPSVLKGATIMILLVCINRKKLNNA